MDEQTKRELFEKLGYITAKVEDIPDIKKRLDTVESKVSNILGWASGAGAVFGLAFSFVKDWFTKR
jgi:hypothetical protein